jgi:DNA polymerase elongation subunit (family B)
MDHGRYIDFCEDVLNTVWALRGRIGGEVSFNKERLEHIIYGDSDSFYAKIPDTLTDGITVDDAVEIADTVCELTNNTYHDFAQLAFNCPPERTYAIQSTREVVADSGLLLTKKRYVLRVVDDEGKRVNKIKAMGVEVKKSDTSIAVKNILTELVNLILDDCSMEDVLKRVKEIKEEYKSLPVFDIAVPCNTKTLTKINKQYEATGSLKGAHYSAKAAFMWNRMKTNQDQEVYAGQKVGLVYVKHKDFNCIGYPIDLQTLPDWFLDIPVDTDKMWTTAYKKITNYLKSVGWDIESRKEEARNELFGF